jgi:hypothetical protein
MVLSEESNTTQRAPLKTLGLKLTLKFTIVRANPRKTIQTPSHCMSFRCPEKKF